ncbi:MAG: hypothetical protein WCW02_04165 [Candidatus Buchananbacteria bacterium]
MAKEHSLIGNKGIDDLKWAQDLLERDIVESLQKINGELEKSPEELKAIEKINFYLNQELATVGLDAVIVVEPERIHFLPQEIYKQEVLKEHQDSPGIAYGAIHKALINVNDSSNRLVKYKTILHEMVHLGSFIKLQIKADTKDLYLLRAGYQNYHPQEPVHEHFGGLNEAVTDLITFRIWYRNREALMKEFSISQEEVAEAKPASYEAYFQVLVKIIKGVASQNNLVENKIWDKLVKNYFTGEVMFLREVEKTFGKGSLRILAAMGSAEKVNSEENYKKQSEFFSNINEERRQELAKEILSEQEWLKYQERRN